MEDKTKMMDEKAEEAKAVLRNMPKEFVKPVAEWFGVWYKEAGHKRLGRVLVAYSKGEVKGIETEKEEVTDGKA